MREATAWDSIGWDDGEFIIKGGRAKYQAVLFNCANRGERVKLARLETLIENGRQKVREVSRYVAPETVLVFEESE